MSNRRHVEELQGRIAMVLGELAGSCSDARIQRSRCHTHNLDLLPLWPPLYTQV